MSKPLALSDLQLDIVFRAGRALRRKNPCYEESSYAELPL